LLASSRLNTRPGMFLAYANNIIAVSSSGWAGGYSWRASY
jgi:hypothetical protein